ncbi:MAG: hypothetical protein COV45_07690 [Deltaproteobacteria bacterium CG11_big_fil_rev_8_21_14_0_20_47_16]|nr:MAG: hypothetical protein COV45_07690 [Deltaproteobacteria bacterium CG11_big_fil_rev_8_21_14_0_20_47_16]
MYKRCIMILADGARADRVSAHLAAGRLPNIQEIFLKTGSYHEGTTVFPSTTGPAYFPFLTGCYPGTVNVTGIRWLDKRQFAKPWFFPKRRRSYVGLETFWINHDMDRSIETAFDIFPRSYNIFNSVNKGVTFSHNKTWLMRLWYWYYAHLTDRWSLVEQAACEKVLDVIKKPFDFCFAVFPAIDEYSHLSGPLSRATDDAYFKLDDYMGQIRDALAKKGQLQDTLIWLISDHGFSATHTHFCANEFLEERGIRTFFYPLIFKKNCIAANMMSGNAMAHLYFKDPSGWNKSVTLKRLVDLYGTMVDDLVREPAVDICAVRGEEGAIEVLSKRGHATVRRNGDLISYDVQTQDPFGYGKLPSIMSSQESLSRTYGTDYPDAPYQLGQLFQSDRTGDIVISAAPGYDLRRDYEVPEHHGSHGALHRDHMLIPIGCSAKLTGDVIRSVDVFPTTLALMGQDIPLDIDGVSRV